VTTSPSQESERRTRRERIDPKLRAAGWTIAPFDSRADQSRFGHHAIEEFPTANGPADYALFVDGQLVGVVEAKKVTLGPQNVLLQAERYALGLPEGACNHRGLHAPFLFSTNGEVVWFHDVRHSRNLSRKITDFFTPSALAELLLRDFEGGLVSLAATSNDHPRLRPYQIDANAAVEHAIADRKRQMLVAMATGTGKTFTTVNQVYRLMKSKVAKRVLFLVDRRALAAQAVRSFAAFEPVPGLKFDKIYEVYSQKFKREDFDEDEKFDPKVLPTSYLMEPQPATP
jgi:type I restriction enzyme, R subunit